MESEIPIVNLKVTTIKVEPKVRKLNVKWKVINSQWEWIYWNIIGGFIFIWNKLFRRDK